MDAVGLDAVQGQALDFDHNQPELPVDEHDVGFALDARCKHGKAPVTETVTVAKRAFDRIPDLQFALFTVTTDRLGGYEIVEHNG